MHPLVTNVYRRDDTRSTATVVFVVEVECEDDGRWIADVPRFPGALAYGDTRDAAIRAALDIALPLYMKEGA